MRHVLSLLLSLVLAPLVYVCAGYSAVKFGEANEVDNMAIGPVVLGLVAALLAGGLYALLVMGRLSPVGPGLAGLLYLGVTLWALLNPAGFRDTMPAGILGADGALHEPAGAGTALLSVPLLLTILSPRRWRRTDGPRAAGPYDAAPAYPEQPTWVLPTHSETVGTTSRGYGSSGYEPPSYGLSTWPQASTAPTYEPSPYEPSTYQPPARSGTDAGLVQPTSAPPDSSAWPPPAQPNPPETKPS